MSDCNFVLLTYSLVFNYLSILCVLHTYTQLMTSAIQRLITLLLRLLYVIGHLHCRNELECGHAFVVKSNLLSIIITYCWNVFVAAWNKDSELILHFLILIPCQCSQTYLPVLQSYAETRVLQCNLNNIPWIERFRPGKSKCYLMLSQFSLQLWQISEHPKRPFVWYIHSITLCHYRYSFKVIIYTLILDIYIFILQTCLDYRLKFV